MAKPAQKKTADSTLDNNGVLTDSHRSAFERGGIDFGRGLTLSDNPFPPPVVPKGRNAQSVPCTSEHHFWRIGWRVQRWLNSDARTARKDAAFWDGTEPTS